MIWRNFYFSHLTIFSFNFLSLTSHRWLIFTAKSLITPDWHDFRFSCSVYPCSVLRSQICRIYFSHVFVVVRFLYFLFWQQPKSDEEKLHLIIVLNEATSVSTIFSSKHMTSTKQHLAIYHSALERKTSHPYAVNRRERVKEAVAKERKTIRDKFRLYYTLIYQTFPFPPLLSSFTFHVDQQISANFIILMMTKWFNLILLRHKIHSPPHSLPSQAIDFIGWQFIFFNKRDQAVKLLLSSSTWFFAERFENRWGEIKKIRNEAQWVRLTFIQIPKHPEKERRRRKIPRGCNPMIHLYISSIITSLNRSLLFNIFEVSSFAASAFAAYKKKSLPAFTRWNSCRVAFIRWA